MLLQTDFEPSTWQSFWQVVIEGDKPAAVAAKLGMPVNAVHLAKARVLRRLKQEIEGFVDQSISRLAVRVDCQQPGCFGTALTPNTQS
jgi:hypothetical protein